MKEERIDILVKDGWSYDRVVKMAEYEEMFDDVVPSVPSFVSLTDEEMIKMIDNCLENKKDLYEMGYIKDDCEWD